VSATKQQEQISKFLKGLPSADPAEATFVESDADPIEEMVWSLLLWETTAAKAERAFKRIRAAVVDLNEFRVCMPDEVVDLLGRGYPNVNERADALLRSLHDVYRREHKVTLEPLRAVNKRDAKKYLESIDGLPRFAAARVTLVALGGHAIPVDEQMRAGMIEAGAIDADTDLDQAASLLERCVKASDAMATHASMLAWAQGDSSKKSASSTRKPTKKRTRKKAAGTG
jgi:endonuclease III